MDPILDKNELPLTAVNGNALFERVVSILEQARANVVRSVNSNMVVAYWLIGQEIVEEIQDGEERAEYGKQVIENLLKQLDAKYKKGFSVPNLRNFRQFYQIYQNRSIHYPTGSESVLPDVETRGRWVGM